MTKDNLDLLNRVANTLMLIDTQGEISFAPVHCIQSIKQVIDSETELMNKRACAPVKGE